MSPGGGGRTTFRRGHTLPFVTVLTLASVAACTPDGADRDADPMPSAASPSAGRLDLSGLPVPRGPFCDRIAEDAVEEALGAEVASTAHYDNGDVVSLPGVRDVVHEDGCVYEAADGAAARAWVFARPVTAAEAETLVRRPPGCDFPDPLTFGRPGLVSVCEVAGGDTGADGEAATTRRVRYEGLFGDTWLGCELTEPLSEGSQEPSPSPSGTDRSGLEERAEQWCTGVATALGAS